MHDKKCVISALGHFVHNSRYSMVDHYQMMTVTEKGASRSKTLKEEAKMYKNEFKNV